MLKFKDTAPKFLDADGWSKDDPQQAMTLASIKQYLEGKCQRSNVPVVVEQDQMKCGNLLNKDNRECLVVMNGEHKRNYIQYVLVFKQEYGRTYISYRLMGESKDMGKEARKEGARDARNAYASQQGGIGAHLGAAMGNAIGGIGAGKRAARIENEKQYYSMISQIIEESMEELGFE